MSSQRTYCYLFFLLLLLLDISCNRSAGSFREEEALSFNNETSSHVQNYLSEATGNNGKIEDSLTLNFTGPVEDYYYNNHYLPLWSDTGIWMQHAKDLIKYYDEAVFDGLIKQDYHYDKIQSLLVDFKKDSLRRQDNKLWAKADVILTDAFMHMLCDLKQGRLQSDSLSWKNDTSKYINFFAANLDSLRNGKRLNEIFESVQPHNKEYVDLKKCIRSFLNSMDKKNYTYLKYPYKKGDVEDSLSFIKSLKFRLKEGGYTKVENPESIDSAELRNLILTYQRSHNLIPDGIASAALVKLLNLTDKEKFIRICITLDRYKLVFDKLPSNYISVNLPAFKLKILKNDSVQLISKIICGKSSTPTPTLHSKISDIIIYPTWTVPTSIISKEILPGLKRNSGYLEKKGLKLLNQKGESVDPSTINWEKYSKGVPYKVQQGSGDQNALGVMKFNFQNPFDVYLHDTNQRYLFNSSNRALSHGCVRVQEWRQLAYYIARNDSINLSRRDLIRYNCDSISSWLSEKKRREVKVENPISLFISYYTCEGVDGKMIFHEDIYNDDYNMKEVFFKKNTIAL